jgi:putative transposase
MTNAKRVIADDAYYHLYNRGNHKEPLFHQTKDYEKFLWLITDAAAEWGVDIHAYCLMPNHYHALVRQRSGGAFVRMMRSFTVSYSMYYNRAYGQVGHLFQGRYRLRAIESDVDLLWVSRYIHQNPLAIARIDRYEWSSYRDYMGGRGRFCKPRPVLETFMQLYGGSYATFCEDVERTKLLGNQIIVAQASPGGGIAGVDLEAGVGAGDEGLGGGGCECERGELDVDGAGEGRAEGDGG